MQQFYNVVSPGYWRTMGIPLLAGRDFDEWDRFAPGDPTELPTVAIVNRKFAEQYFGKRSPIGRHLGLGLGSDAKSGVPRPVNIRIVGMVENSLYAGPRAGVQRQVFFTYQANTGSLPCTFYVRTTIEPKAMFPALRRAIAKLNSSLAIYEAKTLDQQLNETLATNRLIVSLSVVFGALATVLAALGLYGVLAFTVAQRTKEIGIRMALGAKRQSVLWLVARELLIVLGAGFAAGIPCAYIFSQYLSSQLFGVTPTDTWTCGVAVVMLGLVAGISGFVPARRASTIDPLTALRHE
jgi:predicted permease